VIFVGGALPGDLVRARIGKSKRSHAEAAAIELIEAAPARIADTCTHGGEPCPGAAWQGLPYQAQLAEKERQTSEALERLGGFDGFDVEPIVEAVEQWRYRNKLEYSFGSAAEGDPEPALGYHARGRWDTVIDVEDCKLASAANNSARNRIRGWARAEDLAPFDSADGSGILRNLIVRDGRRTGQIQTRLVTTPKRIPEPPVDLHTVVESERSGTVGATGALGAEHLHERLCDLDLRVSALAFLQTNTETAEQLYATAREFAALTSKERLFDIYCGIGTIGLTMAADAAEVWGIETVPSAIEDAEHNASANGIGNARFRVGDARVGIGPLLEEAGKPDLVVLDPPRAGLSQKIVRRVLECEPKRIVYVSCNPTTLAPNARQIVDAGYRLTRVKPVDMFPQTPHIECVALLERTGTTNNPAASSAAPPGAAE